MFQIYTAPRNVLESQTATRVMQMPGVLPKHVYDALNNDSETNCSSKAKKYLRVRCQKYTQSQELKERVEEIKRRAMEKPSLLTIVFMDEAHYSATR